MGSLPSSFRKRCTSSMTEKSTDLARGLKLHDHGALNRGTTRSNDAMTTVMIGDSEDEQQVRSDKGQPRNY